MPAWKGRPAPEGRKYPGFSAGVEAVEEGEIGGDILSSAGKESPTTKNEGCQNEPEYQDIP